MNEITYVEPAPEIVNRICFVVPTHPSRFPWFYELVESYLAQRIFEQADFMVVLSNDQDFEAFNAKLGQVFEVCPQLKVHVMDNEVYETLEGKEINWAVVKKFYGIEQAFESNEDYDYVLCIDDECEFFSRPNQIYDEVDRYWRLGKIYSTKNTNEFIQSIIAVNKSYFSQHCSSTRLPEGDDDYFWFNDIPIYERSSYEKFLDHFNFPEKLHEVPFKIFEYMLYAYFLIEYDHFELVDLSWTHSVPENLTNGSFLEELAVLDRNYIKVLEEIDPMWLPFQCIELKDWLASRAFISFHKDRLFTKVGQPPEKLMLPLIRGPLPEIDNTPETTNNLFREFGLDQINYKYNEKELLQELQAYVDDTYSEHYAQGKIQTTEFIIDMGDGIPFTRGNVIKYAQRYGKKGGRNRKDLLKILHYALIMLYVHDKETKELDNAN